MEGNGIQLATISQSQSLFPPANLSIVEIVTVDEIKNGPQFWQPGRMVLNA